MREVSAAMSGPVDLLQGTLDLLVLKTLSRASEHGRGIMRSIRKLSRNALQIQSGSLYPALARLENKGFLRSVSAMSETHRLARYYHLTPAGKRALSHELLQWNRFSAAINLIVDGES